ncbi:hypothetical protein PI125_g14955 [Phytophthora idaei]|nr:hypothetical protein PI125_g14955 [Phytophthora idaei]
MEKEEEKDSSLELLGSPALQNLWNEGKMDDDELLLSPIHSGSATPSHSSRQNNLMTPATTKLDPQLLAEKLLTPEAVREVNDPAVWSNDQLNCILSDMIRDVEGGRRNRSSQQPEGQSMEEQLQLLRKKMDSFNPNVPFASDGDGSNSLSTGLTGRAGLHFRGSGIQFAALNLAGLQILFDHYKGADEMIERMEKTLEKSVLREFADKQQRAMADVLKKYNALSESYAKMHAKYLEMYDLPAQLSRTQHNLMILQAEKSITNGRAARSITSYSNGSGG